MNATPFMVQNTNNPLFVRQGLHCEKEPASERDSDGPVNREKNDGVGHAILYCSGVS
jgi:hypothetical protein